MLIGKHVVCAPGFLFAEPAISSGGSSVMLEMNVHVHLLVFIEQTLWCTIVRRPVILETLLWTIIYFLLHIPYFLDVNGWSLSIVLDSSPNVNA